MFRSLAKTLCLAHPHVFLKHLIIKKVINGFKMLSLVTALQGGIQSLVFSISERPSKLTHMIGPFRMRRCLVWGLLPCISNCLPRSTSCRVMIQGFSGTNLSRHLRNPKMSGCQRKHARSLAIEIRKGTLFFCFMKA